MHSTTARALLGVPQLADAASIKQAFRKRALVHHPDHGGSPEAFQQLMDAQRVALETIHPAPVAGKSRVTGKQAESSHSGRRWLRTDEPRVGSSIHRVDCSRRHQPQQQTSPAPTRRSFADVLAAAMVDA